MAPLQFVDISGLGFCGKAVLSDLFREVEDFHVPDRFFEFNLIRIQGGLLDLRHAMLDEFSVIRMDAALDRFERVARITGTVADLRSPRSLAMANGMSYEKYFKGTFLKRTERYLQELTDFVIPGVEWPYPSVDDPGYARAARRALRNLFIKRRFLRSVRFARPEAFTAASREYLDDLFRAHEKPNIVLHNAFETFNPEQSIELFHDAKSIIVERDIRDIYVGALTAEPGPGGTLNRKWLGVDDVDMFVRRQELMYAHMPPRSPDDTRVIRMTFEDIIQKYDESRMRLFRFLKVDPSRHVRPRKFFDPGRSKRNIGLWKTFKDQETIVQLERRLPHLCFQGIDR